MPESSLLLTDGFGALNKPYRYELHVRNGDARLALTLSKKHKNYKRCWAEHCLAS